MEKNNASAKAILLKSALYAFIGGISATTFFLVLATTPKSSETTTHSEVTEEQSSTQFTAFTIPSALNLAGEPVPLTDFEVRERIDHELLINIYRHSASILAFKRANRYFPIIEPILAKYEIPDDFKYLAVIESNLANVTSPADAVGFWQFLEKTGRQFGLEINEEVDERYDPEKATEAACKYLREAYRKFGNWTLAAASYNMGMAGINEQLSTQKVQSYYDLRLNNETARYIPRLLATKTVFEAPHKFGFTIQPEDLYPFIPTQTITVNTAVASWIDFAIEHKTTYKMLRELNPWIRKPYLKNSSLKTYVVKLPANPNVSYQELQKLSPNIFKR